jgi:hypothetical protein
MKKGLQRLLFAFAAAPLVACTSVPLGSPEEDNRAKNRDAHPAKSTIYLYRHETLGFAAPMTVSLNGRPAGRTLGQTYFMWEVEPGRHSITSHAENVAAVHLVTEPGRAYYVWQEVKVGVWSARSMLHEVDAQIGRTGMAECMIVKVAH